MKIWVDHLSAPDGYYHCQSVHDAIITIDLVIRNNIDIEEISIGGYATNFLYKYGGHYPRLLRWLNSSEYDKEKLPIKLHCDEEDKNIIEGMFSGTGLRFI